MEKLQPSFLQPDEYLYMTPQGVQKLAQIYDPSKPLKHILYTDDYNVELPIKMKKTGDGSEMPLTTIDILEAAVKNFKTLPALKVKRGGKYVTWTYEQFHRDALRLAKGLLALGIRAEKAMNIIGFNSPEWMIAFYGSIYASVLPTGVYTTSVSDACQYIAEHSEAEIVLAEDKRQLLKYLDTWDRLPMLKYLVLYGELVPNDLPAQFQDRVITFTRLLELGDSFKSTSTETVLNTECPYKLQENAVHWSIQ